MFHERHEFQTAFYIGHAYQLHMHTPLQSEQEHYSTAALISVDALQDADAVWGLLP